jgi:hypothetical protein
MPVSRPGPRRWRPTRGAGIRRSGDTLIAWKLDRLARSMKQLIDFASEHLFNSGPVRRGLQKFLLEGTRPAPVIDPGRLSIDDPDIKNIASRVLINRWHLLLDLLRRNPRFALCSGTAIGRRRDQLLAQNFLEEITDRKLGPGIRGVLQLGANHAKAVSDTTEPTSRMILEKRGFKCVSIRTLSDFTPESNNAPDDAIFSLGTPLDNIMQGDLIRLTSLADKTPVTIPRDKSLSGRPSPLRNGHFRT